MVQNREMSSQEPPPPPSDFGSAPPPPPGWSGSSGQAPPPPGWSGSPGHAPPPPPGAHGQAPPAPYGQVPPPYAGSPYGGAQQKPPRPDVKVGALLTIAGSLISIIGVFLPWLSVDGESQNGTGVFISSDFTIYDNPGAGVIVFAVVTAGLGIALFFAGRVLAVAIIAIVVAVLAVFVGIGVVAIAADTADFGDGSLGIGAILQPIAALVTLAGSITATAKRRRWPTH